MGIWQPTVMETNASYRAAVGPLRMWLKRGGDELSIAVERRIDPDRYLNVQPLIPASDGATSDVSWGRWVVGDAGNRVQLIPTTPDRPVVVRPEVPLRLPSKQEALFFVNFPIWVRIVAGEKHPVTLCEEPCVVLSKTWFGDPMSGTLGYSMRTRARRDIAETDPRPHRAICPVRIHNSATQQLELERFCVHVEHLTIFEGATRLWANQIDVTFRGDNEVSQMEYAKKPPNFESVGEAICKPRRPLKESLLERSLGSLGLFADDGG